MHEPQQNYHQTFTMNSISLNVARSCSSTYSFFFYYYIIFILKSKFLSLSNKGRCQANKTFSTFFTNATQARYIYSFKKLSKYIYLHFFHATKLASWLVAQSMRLEFPKLSVKYGTILIMADWRFFARNWSINESLVSVRRLWLGQ